MTNNSYNEQDTTTSLWLSLPSAHAAKKTCYIVSLCIEFIQTTNKTP
jgi:hypothetical protein